MDVAAEEPKITTAATAMTEGVAVTANATVTNTGAAEISDASAASTGTLKAGEALAREGTTSTEKVAQVFALGHVPTKAEIGAKATNTTEAQLAEAPEKTVTATGEEKLEAVLTNEVVRKGLSHVMIVNGEEIMTVDLWGRISIVNDIDLLKKTKRIIRMKYGLPSEEIKRNNPITYRSQIQDLIRKNGMNVKDISQLPLIVKIYDKLFNKRGVGYLIGITIYSFPEDTPTQEHELLHYLQNKRGLRQPVFREFEAHLNDLDIDQELRELADFIQHINLELARTEDKLITSTPEELLIGRLEGSIGALLPPI